MSPFSKITQEYLGRMQGVKKFRLAPHASKILFITDPMPIAAVGVNDCLCPTIRQAYEAGRLTGEFVKAGEDMLIVSEQPVTALSGCEAEEIRAGLYRIRQTGEGLAFCLG